MADTGAVTIFIFIFITILGLVLNSMGYATFTVLNPTTFAIGQILLMAVVALSNTPLAKGVSLVFWSGWLIFYILSLNIPVEVVSWIFPIIIVPSLIGMGYELMEVGKG